MRSKDTAMRYIFTILLLLACGLVRAEDKATAPDFSKYSQDKSFKYYLFFQTNGLLQLDQTNLLWISAFPSGEGSALQYIVTESGDARDALHLYDWAVRSIHRKQLSETNLVNLRMALRQLPSKSISPPLKRLVIVSFREGTNWITRSYDSEALPKPMQQIYDIIGERFESKRNRK